MKFLFAILGFVAVVFQTAAQTNNVKNGFETITVTNWIKPGPYLRIVNGQLYNIAYSKLWDNLWHLAHSSVRPYSNPNPLHTITTSVVIEKISKDKIICGVHEKEYEPETYTGALTLVGNTFLKTIVVYNYPNAEMLTSGQAISGDGQSVAKECRCIKVENYIDNGVSYEAYDCGVQSTNLVPVVKEEKIKVSSTNSIANP